MRRFEFAPRQDAEAPWSGSTLVDDQQRSPDTALSPDEVVALRRAFYRLSTSDLYRLRSTLTHGAQSIDDLAIAAVPTSGALADWIRHRQGRNDVRSIAELLDTVAGVLLTLYMVAEEYAPPLQVVEVIEKAATGRLHEMPVPRGVECFCGSGKKFKRCHARNR
jgi:hypothetical protein